MNNLKKISDLDGFTSVKAYFHVNDITALNRKELYALVTKMAELNTTQKLDAYFSLVFDVLKNYGEGFRYWIPIAVSNVIAIAALYFSIRFRH